MKEPNRKANLLFALLMSLILPLIMTFFTNLIQNGFGGRFVFLWMKSYAIAFLVAFPSILLISPLIRKLVVKITG